MRNILVFPCGSEIGLDIYNSVKYSTHFHLIGGSSVEDHGMYVYDDYIPNIPFIHDTSFISAIKSIVSARNISAIYPTMDSVIELLKRKEEELGCRVIASPSHTTKICLSKSLTYEALRSSVRTPVQLKIDDAIHFPVFVKPDIGYGAKGAETVYDRLTLENIISHHLDYLILEYLPGEEYTVDCFTDKKKNLIYTAARKRNRIKSGISVNTSFVEDQTDFIRIANKINAILDFRGAWFFQVKRDSNGQLCLLEIASRLGGSSLLSKAIGVNLALMSLFDAFDIDVQTQINDAYHATLDRALETRYRLTGLYYNTVYIDYDDCLILKGSVINTELVRFLYHCINHKKKIVLLTKHSGDLTRELQEFRLNSIFDDIIHIKPEERKTDFISDINSIFIDDSFEEREIVKRKFGISVFGPEMVDTLL